MNYLEGTATLTRLVLRRERVMIPVWIVLIVVLVVGVAVNAAQPLAQCRNLSEIAPLG